MDVVGLGPGDEVVGGHRVDDALGLDAHPGGLVAAVGLPLELAGRVGVGVDRDLAVPVEGQSEQLLGRVLALGPAVDLDRGVEVGAGGEHDVGVELALRATGADDLAAGAVAEDVDVGAGDGQHHAAGHLLLGHPQLRVHAGDDDVEPLEQVVVLVERAVLEDVDLHAR